MTIRTMVTGDGLSSPCRVYGFVWISMILRFCLLHITPEWRLCLNEAAGQWPAHLPKQLSQQLKPTARGQAGVLVWEKNLIYSSSMPLKKLEQSHEVHLISNPAFGCRVEATEAVMPLETQTAHGPRYPSSAKEGGCGTCFRT